MSADIETYLADQIEYNERRAEQTLANLDLPQRAIAVAARIANHQPYSSINARKFYAGLENRELPLNPRQVSRALNDLVDACIVDRGKKHGAVRMASTAISKLLRQRFPDTGED